MKINKSVGGILMDKVRNAAMKNFLAGIFEFVLFGSVNCAIQHMHSDEYGVCIFDPVIGEYAEILRIKGTEYI